jgi:hypothetical protein
MHYHRLLRFAGNCASAALLMIVATSADTFAAPPDNAQGKGPITIEKMGSFFVGGTVITAPGTFDPSKCGTS